MRNAQIKVALRPADREFLDWAAGALGERLAGHAAAVLAAYVSDQLNDDEVRMAYRLHRQDLGLALPDGQGRAIDPAAARAIRDSLRAGVGAR